MAAKKPKEVEEAPVKTKVSMVKAEDNSLVTVELIGTHNELLGEHTVFHGSTHTSFLNGTAEVSKSIADELRKLGTVK